MKSILLGVLLFVLGLQTGVLAAFLCPAAKCRCECSCDCKPAVRPLPLCPCRN